MSARITKPDAVTLRSILNTWQASLPRMIDQERTIDMAFTLMQDPDTQWYRLPENAYLLLRGTVLGEQAQVQILTRNGEMIIAPAETRDVLREAMHEYKLVRLNAIIPTSLPWRDYKLLGFRHEGHVRKCMQFNGEWADGEILGALESEVGIARRRRRKRAHKAQDLGKAKEGYINA